MASLAAIAIMGLPAAGKTTLAKALAERVTARTVSRDVIRLAMFEPCSFTHEEKMAAFDAMLVAIAANWKLGHLTIAEGMPFSRLGEFEAVNEILAPQGGRAAPLFLEIDPQIASSRIAEQRAASVPMAADRDTDLAQEVHDRFRPLPAGTHVIDATLPEAQVLQNALTWLETEMTENKPVACSLDAPELERRLVTIAEIGADSLVSREVENGRHLLRFRASATTRQRLERIVAAEAECCSFLDLSLTDEGDELVLAIAAPEEGQAVADELAEAFARLD